MKKVLGIVLVGMVSTAASAQSLFKTGFDAECRQSNIDHGYQVEVRALPTAWAAYATVTKDTGFGSKKLGVDFQVDRLLFPNPGEKFSIKARRGVFEIQGDAWASSEDDVREASGTLKAEITENGKLRLIEVPVTCLLFRNDQY